MKIVRLAGSPDPSTGVVTDTNILYMDFIEAGFDVWGSGTTYAVDDLVYISGERVVGPNGYQVYKSLQGSNLNKNPATETAWWAPAYTAYKPWTGSDSYAVGDRTYIEQDDIDSWSERAENDGLNPLGEGAPAYIEYYGIYQALAAMSPGGVDATFPVNDANWARVGYVGIWNAFDGTDQQATSIELEDEINVTLEYGEAQRVDTIALLGMSGVENVNITINAPDATELHNVDYDLTDGTNLTKFDWFFSATETVYDLTMSDIAITNLPNDADAEIIITMTGTGTVGIAQILCGQAIDLGDTAYNAGVGIVDHSLILADDFGVRAITQRDFARTYQGNTMFNANRFSQIHALLASLRATPTILLGDDTYSASVQYGLLKTWNLNAAHPNNSTLSLEFQGL